MPPLDITDERLTREDTGYHKGLHSRQLQMIALGGAIGTGLFLGAGGRLASAGPGLFLVYGICGIFVFLILRALGELVLHRPSSGSFVSYAREFYGEKVAFVAGWMYFLNWAMTGIVDTTAIAHYEPPRHVRRLQFLERMGSCQVVHRGGTRRSCVSGGGKGGSGLVGGDGGNGGAGGAAATAARAVPEVPAEVPECSASQVSTVRAVPGAREVPAALAARVAPRELGQSSRATPVIPAVSAPPVRTAYPAKTLRRATRTGHRPSGSPAHRPAATPAPGHAVRYRSATPRPTRPG